MKIQKIKSRGVLFTSDSAGWDYSMHLKYREAIGANAF